MESDSKNSFDNFMNPIDEVEEILFAYGLEFLRKNNDEIFLRYSGIWNNYEMSFSWIKNSNLVQINNDLSISIPEEMIIGIQRMISIVNEKIKLGYFGFSTEKSCIYFRHNVLLRGGVKFNTEQVEEFFDLIADECDKYYPAFQIYLQKHNDPVFALKSALLETVGEA
tara:strand:+ start:53 stop:556 length:504 start_codon:yes stop_codon:yes gene_type:complete